MKLNVVFPDPDEANGLWPVKLSTVRRSGAEPACGCHDDALPGPTYLNLPRTGNHGPWELC